MSFCLSASNPLFPSLLPRPVDPLWHKVDAPKDEDAELTKLEKEHDNWKKNIEEKTYQHPPIGKTSQENHEEDEMDDEEDDNDNDSEHVSVCNAGSRNANLRTLFVQMSFMTKCLMVFR